VAPDVAAVRALWDRSGAQAGPAISAQLSAFADAMLRSSAHPQAAGVAEEIERMLATPS
jgi:hypothetical protein